MKGPGRMPYRPGPNSAYEPPIFGGLCVWTKWGRHAKKRVKYEEGFNVPVNIFIEAVGRLDIEPGASGGAFCEWQDARWREKFKASLLHFAAEYRMM